MLQLMLQLVPTLIPPLVFLPVLMGNKSGNKSLLHGAHPRRPMPLSRAPQRKLPSPARGQLTEA
jgi:hypothetical protein